MAREANSNIDGGLTQSCLKAVLWDMQSEPILVPAVALSLVSDVVSSTTSAPLRKPTCRKEHNPCNGVNLVL